MVAKVISELKSAFGLKILPETSPRTVSTKNAYRFRKFKNFDLCVCLGVFLSFLTQENLGY